MSNDYKVSKESIEGEPSYVLIDHASNSEAVIVPGIGNQVIRYEVQGRSMVLTPPDIATLRAKFTRFGVPVLSPPNRVKNATFSYNNRTYHLPPNPEMPHHMHGIIGQRPWQVIETGTNEVEGAYIISQFSYIDHPDIMAYFPHHLVFEFTYRLKEGKLSLEGHIVNAGMDAAPFGLGFHPYFPIALREDVELIVPAVNEWPIVENFVTGLPQETEYCKQLREGISVTLIPTEGYQLIGMQPGNNRCEIIDKQHGTHLIYETDNHFPFMVIFKPAWADALSLEPYTCITDPFNAEWPQEIIGALGIAPSDTFSFNWVLYSKKG